MKKEIKKYLDIDVYEAAKQRIKHVLNLFDNVLVAFSGGKDSLCVLNLVKEVYAELGIKEKVKVFFRDEELIPDNVIEFVQKIATSGEYDFRYYAIPLKSTKFILGNTIEYVQFDPDREWLRQPPEYAITLPKGDKRIFSQYEADEFICQNEKGKVAIINGIRADESLVRLRSCINKKNENYINATESKRIKLVKPIYDWTEKDIFVYFCKNDIRYCDIYDDQLFNNEALRVSTPLHAESAKKFYKIKTRNPKFYDQLVTLFPEMIVQDRYWNEYDRKKTFNANEYAHTFTGLIEYIKSTIDDEQQQKLAMFRVKTAWKTRITRMNAGQRHNFGGYPLLYLFETVAAGQIKREIQPKRDVSYKYYEFEGLSREEYERNTKNNV